MNIRKKVKDTEYTIRNFMLVNNLGEAEIFCRIFYKRQKNETKTDVKGLPEDWDAEIGRFIEGKPYTAYLNKRLDEIGEEIHEAYIKVKNSGFAVTSAKIKQVYLGNEEVLMPASPMLVDYISWFIERISGMTEEYCLGTIQHYETMLAYMDKYLLGKKLAKLRLNELRRKHIMGFETYLLSEPKTGQGKPLKRTTANKYLAKLKKVINYAVGEEEIPSNPFNGFQMVRVKSNKEYLTQEELNKLHANDFGGNESLSRIRYLFLFSVYTGLRFSDAAKLKRSTIETDAEGMYFMVRQNQQKTGNKIFVPMLEQAVEIYLMFLEQFPDSEYVLPRTSNQKVNAYLKVIAEMAGININLTHHIARHTFATTILIDNDVDVKAASALLGHQSMSSTEIYAKISNSRLKEVVGGLNKRRKRQK